MFESEKHFSDQLKDESRGKRFTLTADWSQSRISLCWMFLEASCRAARPRQLNYCDLALFVLSEVHSGHLCLCAHQIGVKFPSGLIISPVCVPTHTHTQTHTHTHSSVADFQLFTFYCCCDARLQQLHEFLLFLSPDVQSISFRVVFTHARRP